MSKISFTVVVGIRGPIESTSYVVRDRLVEVSYPEKIVLDQGRSIQLPKSLSTLFVVSWTDVNVGKQLLNQSFERHLPIYSVLETISELLLAYKLVRIGHIDARGLRTIGIGDTLMFYATVDGENTGSLNLGMKNYAGNNGWLNAVTSADPHGTSKLAAPHIGVDTYPVARRYVRCFELLEHGFYSEAFIVAFSVLDDFVQNTLHELLETKGLASRSERNELLRGIKENRLKLYLGPVLKLVSGSDIETMWPESKAALEWLNSTRNGIAHTARKVDYATAAKGIYACLKVLVVMKEWGVANVDLNVELFRHAKITAAWTVDAPKWIPSGAVAESMDFLS